MLRNRVDPGGELHAVPERLNWFGNRGCLHDAEGRIRRFAQVNRWITCVLSFKSRRRSPLMQPGRYTELFFLDEASAYAAGHRPCAECRRADFDHFVAHWQARYGENRVGPIDRRLQEARMEGKARRLVPMDRDAVPVGAMIREGGADLLRAPKGWYRWSFKGYAPVDAPGPRVTLLTPEPFAALMGKGLKVEIHPSALE